MATGKIGIIGSGPVGQTLAAGFLKYGYSVKIGSRTPSKLKEWQDKANCSTGTFDEAAAYAELVVLAVQGASAEEALKLCKPENLTGKTVIDTTNPISGSNPQTGLVSFYTSLDGSQMEKLQKTFPGAHFVKAFSCTGAPNMVDPDFAGSKPTMFICGNSGDAKKAVNEILVKFGWEVEDMGVAEAARAIEPLCILWCIPGFRENRWNHAFKLLKK